MRLRRRPNLKSESGQSMVEYVLVMFVVVGAILFMVGKLKKSEFFFKKFTGPLVKHITYNYKYADPGAQGWDEGTPRKHIQISDPQGQNFRIFQPDKN